MKRGDIRQQRKKENRLTCNRPKGLWLILLDLSTDSILLVKSAGWLVQKIAERGWVEDSSIDVVC